MQNIKKNINKWLIETAPKNKNKVVTIRIYEAEELLIENFKNENNLKNKGETIRFIINDFFKKIDTQEAK